MGDGGLIFFVVIAFLILVFLAGIFNNPKKDEDDGESIKVCEPRSPEEKLVIISVYVHLADAQLAQITLQSEEIESYLENEYCTLMIPLYSPAMGGVELLVKNSDAERAKKVLEGKIAILKKKTECTYKLEKKDDKYEPVLVYKQVFIYDSIGNISEDLKYDTDNKKPAKRLYFYDESGRLSAEESSYEGVGLFHKVNYKYDEHGNIVEKISSSTAEKSIEKTRYEFNEEGRIVCEECYTAGGAPSTVEKSYDDAGNLTEESFYEGGTQFGKCCYSYNTEGKIVEKTDYENINGPVSEKISYLYSDNGLLKETHTSNANGAVYLKILYQYDEKGYLIGITEFELDDEHKEIPLKMVAIEYEFFNNNTDRNIL